MSLRPGHRVLEIGAGTGYNAALLAYLTGPTGTVTTVDIDEDVAACARRGLAAADWPDVSVIDLRRRASIRRGQSPGPRGSRCYRRPRSAARHSCTVRRRHRLHCRRR
jgi:SAM-dependent methyltransferase